MALASWMSHEEAKAKEVKIVLEIEEKIPIILEKKREILWLSLPPTTSSPMILNFHQDT